MIISKIGDVLHIEATAAELVMLIDALPAGVQITMVNGVHKPPSVKDPFAQETR